MKRKIVLIIILMFLLGLTGCSRQEDDGIVRTEWSHTYEGYPVVYVVRNVSSDGLLSAYESLGASFDGTAAIKLSETNADEGFAWTGLIEELSQPHLWIFRLMAALSFCRISEAMTQPDLMER